MQTKPDRLFAQPIGLGWNKVLLVIFGVGTLFFVGVHPNGCVLFERNPKERHIFLGAP